MKFKLKGENDYNDSPIEAIFRNRGVYNLEELLNVDDTSIIHHSLLVNIYEAADCLLKILRMKVKYLFR